MGLHQFTGNLLRLSPHTWFQPINGCDGHRPVDKTNDQARKSASGAKAATFRSGVTSDGVVRRQRGRVRRLDLPLLRKWPAARLAIVTCGKMTSASDCCKSRQHAAPTIAVAKHPDLAVWLALPASVPALFARRSDIPPSVRLRPAW